MAWFTREKTSLKTEEGERKVRTEGLWLKCEHCGEIIWRKALEDNLQVCPKCGHHDRIDARTRLTMLFDGGQFEEFDTKLVSSDPLEFVDSRTYKKRLASNQHLTHLRDAIISAAGNLNGRRVNICALDLRFIGGSMGAVVGEAITRAIERSLERNVPLIIISASGGARMQEGTVSLMQLAKISAALMRLDEAGAVADFWIRCAELILDLSHIQAHLLAGVEISAVANEAVFRFERRASRHFFG